MNKIVLHQEADRSRLISFILALELNVKTAIEFAWKDFKRRRSNSANGLYFTWMGILAIYFTRETHTFHKDQMHRMMRHLFLGYEGDLKMGRTTIKGDLKSTKGMETLPFCFYMNKVDMWAAERGCLLPRPEDNKYTEYVERNCDGAEG